MNGHSHEYLVAGLFLWSLVSLGTAVGGLYARPDELMRSFWFMNGLWGLIDGGIAWFALIRPVLRPADLAPILRFNAGLDLLYLVAAGVLLSRTAPRPRGFGLAITVQGAFLLAFDLYFWRACVGIAG
jgi:hypothetical protein